MELVALYNENREPCPQPHQRGTALPGGTYMVIAAVWVALKDGRLLTTLRSAEKQVCPNTWENPGGAVRWGESSAQGAARELWEETGIAVQPKELKLIHTRRTAEAFVDTYLLRLNQAEEPVLHLQSEETADARWLTAEQLEQLLLSGAMAPPIAQDLQMALPTLKKELRCDGWQETQG